MPCVADKLRQASRREARRLTTERRLELAFQLGDEAVAAYAARNGLDPREATRRMERRRQRGRRPSACVRAAIG